MSIGTVIIQRALQKIGAHSVASPASAESIEFGMEELNSMCDGWLSQGIEWGFTPLKTPGDNINEPNDVVRNAVINNLAIRLSPDFDNGTNVTSPRLESNAALGLATMDRLYRKIEIPKKVVSSMLPRGQGNNRFGRTRTFFTPGETIDA